MCLSPLLHPWDQHREVDLARGESQTLCSLRHSLLEHSLQNYQCQRPALQPQTRSEKEEHPCQKNPEITIGSIIGYSQPSASSPSLAFITRCLAMPLQESEIMKLFLREIFTFMPIDEVRFATNLFICGLWVFNGVCSYWRFGYNLFVIFCAIAFGSRIFRGKLNS